MATSKIRLSVGPEKAGGTIFVEARDLVKAKLHAIRVCRRHLPSGNIHLEARGHYTYSIILDMDEMGEVELARLDGCPHGAHRAREPQRQASRTDPAPPSFARSRPGVARGDNY